MASMNIFERYGIKEVANVYFEALEGDQDFNAGDIVLYLDTLKVSNIETTAENVSAQGGWAILSQLLGTMVRILTLLQKMLLFIGKKCVS